MTTAIPTEAKIHKRFIELDATEQKKDTFQFKTGVEACAKPKGHPLSWKFSQYLQWDHIDACPGLFPGLFSNKRSSD